MGPGGMTPGDGILGLVAAPTTALEGSAGGEPETSSRRQTCGYWRRGHGVLRAAAWRKWLEFMTGEVPRRPDVR